MPQSAAADPLQALLGLLGVLPILPTPCVAQEWCQITKFLLQEAEGVGAEELSGHREAAGICLSPADAQWGIGAAGHQPSPGSCWWGQSRTNSLCRLVWVLGVTSTLWEGQLCAMGEKRGFVSDAGITKIASMASGTGRAGR